MRVRQFLQACLRTVLQGGLLYYSWVGFLLLLMGVGGLAYFHQLQHGLIVTGMRDQVAWALYIGNFTFMDGVAVAAILLVIPAYFYKQEQLQNVTLFAQFLAVCAVLMAMLFVFVDLGRPERAWHLIPYLGILNFPQSIMAWDIVSLAFYMVLSLLIALYILYKDFTQSPRNTKILWPLLILSIPAAVGIQTVAAFLYNGLPGRPFWNSAILAPRFLASALCAGPAVILILLQILKRVSSFEVKKETLWFIAELMMYAMFFNVFFLGAEVFKEIYSDTKHLSHFKYLYVGLHGKKAIVWFGWTSLLLQVGAFFLYLIPKLRKNLFFLNLGALMAYFGAFLEKGIALVIPGLTPSPLGEIYEYTPTWTEWGVSAGVFSIGFLLFTLFLKVAIPIVQGQLHVGMFRLPKASDITEES